VSRCHPPGGPGGQGERGAGAPEFEAAFGRIRDAGITYYADPACRQTGQVYTSKSGNRGTYFRDPDGHLMEILTAVGGAPS
jgi:catechol 2,3-dioxygenase-like lactoylglutathione lyase family enzyme